MTVAGAEHLRALAAASGAIVHVDHIDLRKRRVAGGARGGGRTAGTLAGRGPAGTAHADARRLPDAVGTGPHLVAVSLDLFGRAPDRVAARAPPPEPPLGPEDPGGGDLVELELDFGAAGSARLLLGNGMARPARRVDIDLGAGEGVRYDDRAAIKASWLPDGPALAHDATPPCRRRWRASSRRCAGDGPTMTTSWRRWRSPGCWRGRAADGRRLRPGARSRLPIGRS